MQSKLYYSMFLLTLWFVFAFIFGSSHAQGDIYKVCNKLKYKALPGDVQGLAAVDGSLYLMAQDRLYRLSMDRIEGWKAEFWHKHSIALYDRGDHQSGNITDLGVYSNLWVFHKSLVPIRGIRHFNIWVNRAFEGAYRILWEALTTDGVHLCNKTGTAMVHCTRFTNELNYPAGDGSGTRYYLFRHLDNLTVNAAPIEPNGRYHFINATPSDIPKLYYVGLNEQEIVFTPRRNTSDITHLHPLVSLNGPIYGFIHSGVVHLWDLASQQSILFDDPGLTVPPQDYRMAVSKIPFEHYFVCSTADALGLTNPLGLLPVMGYILLGGVILLTLFLLLLKYKKKNSDNKSKDQVFKVMKGHKGGAKLKARKKMVKPMILSSEANSATSNLGWPSSSAIASSNASSVHVISTELNAKASIDPKLSSPTGFRQKKHKPISRPNLKAK